MLIEAEMNEQLIHSWENMTDKHTEKMKFELNIVEWVEIWRQREEEKSAQWMSKGKCGFLWKMMLDKYLETRE